MCYSDVPQIQLVGGEGTAGRVEVWINGTWSTIRDTNWDKSDATVICRQLGFSTVGAQAVLAKALYGIGTGTIWFNGDIDCTGQEQHILDCKIEMSDSMTDDHDNDVGVTCGGGKY